MIMSNLVTPVVFTSLLQPLLFLFRMSLTQQKAAIRDLCGCALTSFLTSVSAEVACQKRWIVSHHPSGPQLKCCLYVLFLVADKQMHLQLQIYQYLIILINYLFRILESTGPL